MHSVSASTVCLALLASGLVSQIPQIKFHTRYGLPPGTDPTFKLAVGDVNGDRAPDVVCANMGSTTPGFQDRLYLNDGVGNFTDVTTTHIPAALDWTGVAALGDMDGDGDLDIFFGNMASQVSRLLENDGTGKFTDVSANRMTPVGKTVYAAAFVDVDFDRDLDLVVKDLLYLNDGRGNFTDVSSTHMPGVITTVWGMEVGDANSDGWPDLVFCGPSVQPRLWLNDKTGKFTDATANLPQGNVDARGTFGFGDVDFDRDLDIYFPFNNGQNRLWLNDGRGNFTDVTATNLPVDTFGEYAATFADIDGDGDLDALTANSNGGTTPFQNRLYVNDGRGMFTDATATRMDARTSVSVALVAADMDQDGDPDIVYGNWYTGNEVWLNQHRNVYAEAPPTLGMNYDIDLYGMPGYATTPQPAIPLLGFRPLIPRLNVPGFGALGINPSLIFILTPGTIAPPGGKHTTRLTIPNDPAIRNLPIYLQGLLFQLPNYYLTNVFADKLQ